MLTIQKLKLKHERETYEFRPGSKHKSVTVLRESFLYAKKTKLMTLFINPSPSCHHSAILESIHWMQTAYAFLCQPHHTDTFSTFIYTLIWTKTAYLCGATDTEQHMMFVFSGYSPKWSYVAMLMRRSYFVFFAYKKYSPSIVKVRLNPWCRIDYFSDLLATFLDVDHVIPVLSLGGSDSSQNASKIS